MKSIILFSFLLLCTYSVSHVFSLASHNVRLYNLLRKSSGTTTYPSIFNDKRTTTMVLKSQSDSSEDLKDIKTRTDWDSGEDYFLWANKNRRPVEYLTGRKREVKKTIIPPRHSRINGGLWLSGLVG